MDHFKRLLVGLDLTAIDKTVIRYTSYLAQILEADQVYFIHVAKSLDMPKKIAERYPDLVAPVDETLKRELSSVVKEHFKAPEGCDYNIEVKEGNPTDKILRWADIKRVDLIIMGRKLDLAGSGILSGKLARIAHCSMLFVPENALPKITRLINPIDFSKHSVHTVVWAHQIAEATQSDHILYNAYTIPSGYHTSGKSKEEFDEIMRTHAYEDVMELLERSNLSISDVQVELVLNEHQSPAHMAYTAAQKMNCDLIVMGSKGRAGLASVLLGSVADKMTQLDSAIPLLIVKDKKENMGFLEALLKL